MTRQEGGSQAKCALVATTLLETARADDPTKLITHYGTP